jgi:hypothetical protein
MSKFLIKDEGLKKILKIAWKDNKKGYFLMACKSFYSDEREFIYFNTKLNFDSNFKNIKKFIKKYDKSDYKIVFYCKSLFGISFKIYDDLRKFEYHRSD